MAGRKHLEGGLRRLLLVYRLIHSLHLVRVPRFNLLGSDAWRRGRVRAGRRRRRAAGC